ncbi:hypothetical protein [Anianabacter salinae]|uniref:hypothetical protein n=1 Tax=Anianabacter salinae TaxID=2851023 RepID=UPI00225E1A80|nr:hypothetical protein [Anianabacter salinae]MBV0912488.1 hypothetical protein [Anianabacter salinae]
MSAEIIILFLALFTLGAVLVLALSSKRKTEARRHDPDAEKSTLAQDAPNRH